MRRILFEAQRSCIRHGMKFECIPARIYSNARVLPISCESLAHNVSYKMQRTHYDTLNIHV